ncbi:MAG: DNA polymerase III subunit gamma/tau [Prevotella sp.]|jgi:DNA polymerase-3 subunit gamma/tau|nr:DNA polymerase III subunit gamma/tau [Prevotella sp.]
MDNYIVSARKYRPATFRSVVGQRALTTTLKNAIASNKLAHAYLFCGPRGVGKTTCARIFAKTINCLKPAADGEACNECESCKAFDEQRSFNIHELDAASNNSVDDIRSLTQQVRIPPQIGKYKVYIIDEVHMLSAAAFNAFLKTLEEPPLHAIFILATTEKHKILPTILSRCQIYDFSRISISDIVEHLQYVADNEQVVAEPEALNVLAQKADGGMRDALSIFDQVVSYTGGNVTYKAVIDNLNVLDYEYYFKLTEAVLSGNVVDTLLILNDILNKGFDGHNIITGIASHFRDLLLCKDPQTAELFEVGASIRLRYIETAQKCSNDFLYKAIDIVNNCDLNYRESRNKQLLSQLTMIKLCQLITAPEEGDEKKNEIIKPLVTAVQQPVQSSAATVTPVTDSVAAPAETRPVSPSNAPSAPPQNTVHTVPGFSIADMLQTKSKPQEQITVKEETVTPVEASVFTAAELVAAWKSLAESDWVGDDHHLRNIILNLRPGLLDEKTFEVVVVNNQQEQKLTDFSPQIQADLQQKLRNSHVEMKIRLTEEPEVKPEFCSPVERFNLMAGQNENLLRLKDEFGLEIS